MGLRAVMAELVKLEELLTIADPVVQRVAKAYLIAPGRNTALETPCFMNWPDAASELRMGKVRQDAITIQVDFLAYDADFDRGAEIALAFFDIAWAAFDSQRPAGTRLGGTVSYLTLRAERPLLETIEWGGQGYPGFHLFLDLVLFEESDI